MYVNFLVEGLSPRLQSELFLANNDIMQDCNAYYKLVWSI